MPKFYSTAGWRHLRERQLRLAPLCAYCAAAGRVVPAEVADHIQPHRGDRSKFFDPQNLQSLCKSCHDSVKQAAEKRDGIARGSDLAGLPLDPRHPWHRTAEGAE